MGEIILDVRILLHAIPGWNRNSQLSLTKPYTVKVKKALKKEGRPLLKSIKEGDTHPRGYVGKLEVSAGGSPRPAGRKGGR